ncbi:MAG: hypothetical protein BGO89_08530 [Candidatus Kapaibacterium thiocyanatum]|uniref:Uncharacterized protein n=1 Tax=Candidatus Kapaibacterium thiocyanatum TaxID=1895771 RepID=A0A1M3L3U0_9BACT|nr:MAG: hypothetical protein BGO89_08530 ['Candidatus Kapabacteria' thiocyanatum]
MIIAIAVTVLGLVAMFFFFQNIDDRGGTLKVTESGVEVTLEKPLAAQLGTESQTVKVLGDSVTFTTGTVSDSAVRKLMDVKGEVSDNRFTGKNLIDTSAGFVISSRTPQQWNVERTTSISGTTSKLVAQDSSIVKVTTMTPPPGSTIASLTKDIVDNRMERAPLAPKPSVRVDTAANTALIWFRNEAKGAPTCVKLVLANNLLYTVVATSRATTEAAERDVIEMASGFTVIAKPSAFVKGTTRLQR